jgi:hypothetical protein
VRQPPVQLLEPGGHLGLELGDKGAGRAGQSEALVAGVTARVEVGGEILVGVAPPLRADDPHLFAPQPVAQALQDTDLVADATDALGAVGRLLDDDVEPLRPDHALDRDLGQVVIPPPVGRGPDRRDRVEERAVGRVVRAELERRQQLRQHASVVRAVGGADHGMDARLPVATTGRGLLDQLLEGLFARDREDHLAHDAVGLVECRFRDFEQDAGLAAHLDRVGKQPLDHALLGLRRDPVGDLDQELDERIDDLGLAGCAGEDQQRQADRLGVAAQLPRRLGHRPPAKALDERGRERPQDIRRKLERADEVELADLGEQALEPDAARVGLQPRECGTRAVVGEQRVEAASCAVVQAVDDGAEGAVIVHGPHRADDAIEPMRARPRHLRPREPCADPLLERERCRLVRQRVLGEPAAELRLGRPVEGAHGQHAEDGAAVTTARSSAPVVTLERVRCGADLGSEMADHRRREVGLVVGETAVGTVKDELGGEAEPARVDLGREQPPLF